MKMDKILCIVPLYNKIRFLPYTLGSVIHWQTEVDVTMVIVDDCSTDGSYEWVQENLGKYPNVHIIRNEVNSGCYVSRNRGLNYAVTNNIEFDYFTVTDPDDQQLRGRFKTIIDEFKLNPQLLAIKQPYLRCNIDTNEVIEKTDAGEGAAIFKREVFEKIGYWDNTLRFGGDTDYVYRLGNWYFSQNQNGYSVMGTYVDPLLYALTDNTGQNLTILHPTNSPERQAVFSYINQFTLNCKVEDCYYEFDNQGHAYADLGAMEEWHKLSGVSNPQ